MTPARDAMDILGVLQSAFPEVAPSKPRLFISHRRTDVEPARRIAKIAVQCGFTYWLDVEDPVLAALGSAGMPGNRMHAILVAAIIEIALLNSTHVIAVLTRNSFPGPVRGEPAQTGPSLWIPYEFGRAKARCLASNQAASWLSGEVAAQAMPEYLYLGRILTDEEGMEEWLRQQGPMALRSYGGIGPRDPIIAGTKTLDHFA